MKYLSDYINQSTTELLNKYGVFFAFSNKQFDEQKQDGKIYVQLPSGALCPKENVTSFLKEYNLIIDQGIAQDLKENGRENIIKRELCNHECSYTGDIQPCVDALESYGITVEEIEAVFKNGGAA